ncbi:unnamed protein product, partial [Hapterophycus canaliculatus]
FVYHNQRHLLAAARQNTPPCYASLVGVDGADADAGAYATPARGATRLGRLFEEGRPTPEAVSMLKRNSCGKALETARHARSGTG